MSFREYFRTFSLSRTATAIRRHQNLVAACRSLGHEVDDKTPEVELWALIEAATA